MIKHIFPKIGQGCCVEQCAYVNCRKIYRVLYDCGSNNLNELKRYIDTIDANVPTTLVISHLHHDHISGIPYLIKHFEKVNRKIERLFLPDYNEETLILLLSSIVANSTYETDDEIYKLIDIISSLQNSDNNPYFGKVIFVAPHSSEGGNYFKGIRIKDKKFSPLPIYLLNYIGH